MLSLGPQELQSMIADSSSCAVLGLLLRILFSPDIILGGRDLAERLARTALECFQLGTPSDLSTLKATPAAVTLFYAMAGDRSGSYFLEAVVECCAVPLVLELLNGALLGSAKEYATDGVGNFVLQALLRRISAELQLGDADTTELIALRNAADSLLGELTAEELLVDLALSKGGVILWMLELSRYTKFRSSSNDWAQLIGTGLISVWTDKGAKQLVTVLSDRLAPKAALDAIAASAQPPKKINGRVVIDKDSAQLLIARLVGALLKLNFTISPVDSPIVRASILVAQAVFRLPVVTLKHIATSGPLSRAVLDTALDQYKQSDTSANVFRDASILLSNLSTLAVELADHFIGQHVLKRAFDKGSAENKESIVTALDIAKEELNKSKEGRNSLRIVQADLFARKPDEWRSLLRKQSAAIEMLKEIETGTTGARHITHPSSSISRDDGHKRRDPEKRNPLGIINGHGESNFGDTIAVEVDEEVAGTTNRKRKRKRPGKKNSEDDEGNLFDRPVGVITPHSVEEKVSSKVVAPSISGPVKNKSSKSDGDRSIDMRKIQKLRSGKVTSLFALGDEIETMAKKSKKK